MIIGILASGMRAPANTAKPPSNSTRIVAHASRACIGMPSACKMSVNASGPRASFAYPCSTKPYPMISRRGIANQDCRYGMLAYNVIKAFIREPSFGTHQLLRGRSSNCYGGRPHDVTMSRSRLRVDRGLEQRLELSQVHAPSTPKRRRKFPLGGSDFLE